MMRTPARLAKLSAIDVEEGKPLPTEFRIFRAGPNPSDRGDEPFVFDAQAAADVMAAYKKHGNRMMMDLEHASLNERAIELRNDATDPMCWYDLELRGGELWGVNAEWTADGERRIRSKLQRFISPAFSWSSSDHRVRELYNTGLVARAGLCSAVDVAANLAAGKITPGASAQLKAAILAALCKPKRAKK